MRRVRVQVAGVTRIEDAALLVEAGVDAIGLTVGLPPGAPDDTSPELAAAIARSLPPFVTPVLITYRSTSEDLVSLLQRTGAWAVQLHGGASRETVADLRAAMPWVRVIRVVHVTGQHALAEAAAIDDADAILLDSYDPERGRWGATGRTHDWHISAAIVRAVRAPVILAGGLRPENVSEAVRIVRPWAVDVHTGVEDAEGRLDPGRVHAFLRAVARAREDALPPVR